MAEATPTIPSLQHLSANKVLDEMMKSNEAIDAFTLSLEPGEQHVLLRTMMKEVSRLKDFEQEWKPFARSCPRIDLQVTVSNTYFEFCLASQRTKFDRWKRIKSQ